jgi:hypothetical protein
MTYGTANGAATCPKCGGSNMYDNREENAQRVATGQKARPDFKCKTAGCEGVIWPPRNGAAPRAAARPASTTKQPTNIGGPLPWEEQETGSAPVARTDVPASFALYDRCFEHAFKVASAAKITDQQAIASMAATLYIQAHK